MTSNTDRIEKHVVLRASLARVWKALTDYKEFGEWFRVNLDSPFVPGRTTRGNITYPGYEHLIMEVSVQALEPMRYFAFHWHPYAVDPDTDYSSEPPTLVEFALEETADGVLLVVTESGFDAIPASRRDEAFRMNDGGWTMQMKNISAHVAL